MLIYGIAHFFKSKLKLFINSSKYFSLSFDGSLNRDMQKCQMDTNVRFWNKKSQLWKLVTLARNFLYGQMLKTCLMQYLNLFPILDMCHVPCAMDCPSVNWNTLEQVNDHLIKQDHNKTITRP